MNKIKVNCVRKGTLGGMVILFLYGKVMAPIGSPPANGEVEISFWLLICRPSGALHNKESMMNRLSIYVCKDTIWKMASHS